MTDADRSENERKEALRKLLKKEREKHASKKYRRSEKGKVVQEASVRKIAQARYYALTGRAKGLLQRYGITLEQYDAMFARQGGKCAICGRPPKTMRLAVEHDHKTKRVRGLACFRCNKLCIGSNTVESARKVLAYLDSDFDGRAL